MVAGGWLPVAGIRIVKLNETGVRVKVDDETYAG
jgi:hypothetical protein